MEDDMSGLSQVWRAGIAAIGIAAFAGAVSAQPIAGGPLSKGTHLITLGTRSGPLPTAVRAQSSNLLIVNGALYLIDAGDGVTRRLARGGYAIRDVDHVFITHLHDDHTAGLIPLMSVQYDMARNKPVDIHGPPGTETLVRAALQYLTVNADIRVSDGMTSLAIGKIFAGHDLGTGTVYRDANVTVKAVENSHFHFPPASPAYSKTKSYSYRFETPEKTIVFTGDTGPSEAVTELAKGADMLVTEISLFDDVKELALKNGRWERMSREEQASFDHHMKEEHLSPDEVGKMASRAAVKTVVLTHIPATSDPKDEYKRYADAVKKFFSGQVLIAKDLMQF
jgi:ribonuclease BN (tRNA processing enzyme)